MPFSKEFQKEKQGKERFFSAKVHQFAKGEAKATRRSQLLSLLATGKEWGTSCPIPEGAAFQGAGFEQTKQGFSRTTLILRGRFLVQPRLCNIFSFDLWVWVKYCNSEKEIGYERVCFVCATTAVAALL